MFDFCSCVENDDVCPLCQLQADVSVEPPKPGFSEVQETTVEEDGVGIVVCYREMLIDTYYGPELCVTWWRKDSPDFLHTSQEPASAEMQIRWGLDADADGDLP